MTGSIPWFRKSVEKMILAVVVTPVGWSYPPWKGGKRLKGARLRSKLTKVLVPRRKKKERLDLSFFFVAGPGIEPGTS